MATDDGSRDWSSLPPDMLRCIAEDNLALGGDFANFRKVCRSWRQAVTITPMSPPRILLPGRGREYGELIDAEVVYCSLDSPREAVVCPIPPAIKDMYVVGGDAGWIALCSPILEALLFEPASQSVIELPPFTTVDFSHDPEGELYVDNPDRKIKKVVFNHKPNVKNVAALALDIFGRALYTTTGSDRWLPIVGPDEIAEYFEEGAEDVLFTRELFWLLHRSGTVLGIQIKSESLPNYWRAFDASGSKNYCFMLRKKFLAPSYNRLNLLVLSKGNHGRFEIMELVSGNGIKYTESRLVTELHGCCLFIGGNNSMLLPATQKCPQSNRIYFIQTLHLTEYMVRAHRLAYQPYTIKIFELDTGRTLNISPELRFINWREILPIWSKLTSPAITELLDNVLDNALDEAAKMTADKSKSFLNNIEHWQKGVASTDVFGVHIEVTVKQQKCSMPVPQVLISCAEYLIISELNAEYLFKRQGDYEVLQQLVSLYNDDCNASLPEGVNPLDIASLILCYLASLPEPLTTFELYHEILSAENSPTSLKNILKKLPVVNYKTLEFITALLLRVSQKSFLNKMDALSLAIELSPVIMWQKDNASSQIPLWLPSNFGVVEVIQCLIRDHNAVFTDANETV